MTGRVRFGAATAAALLLAACGSSGARDAGGSTDHPPSRTEPYLVMTDAKTGIAVWPSGSAWLLLSTSDGFAHVTNRTPQGVDTEGGLAVAAKADHAVAAVGAYERLVRSPVLTGGASWSWDADELPGAVSNSRAAVSAVPQTAVTTARHGTLEERGPAAWRPLTSASSLGARLSLDAITWADARRAWLTGTAADGAAVYSTRDGGSTWSPVPAASDTDVSALPPCGAGSAWLLPVLRAGSMSVLRTSDGGTHWRHGAALPAAAPVFGCSGSVAWALAQHNDTDHVFASADGGVTWRDRGAAPDDVVDLTPSDAVSGYATTGGPHPNLWRVTTGAGAHFTRIALPGWVASIGEQMTSDS